MQELVLRSRLLSEAHMADPGVSTKMAQLELWYQQLQAAHTAVTGTGTSAAAAITSATAMAPVHQVVLPPASAPSRATATHVRSPPNEFGAIQGDETGYSPSGSISELEDDMHDV